MSVLIALGLLWLPATACDLAPGAEPEPERVELVCDRDYMPALEILVDGATETLKVVQWEFFASHTTNDLIELLGDSAANGVEVQLLLDESIEENLQAVERFQNVGVDAQLDSSSSDNVHAKMIVADGTFAMLGSTNWSRAAIEDNRECNLIIREGGAPAFLDAWFDQLWSNSSDRTPADIEQADCAPAAAYVYDQILETLVPRIDAASSSIDFTLYATYLQPSNPDAPAMQVFRALTRATDRGVTVRGVADWSSWNPSNNASNDDAVDWLEDRGVEMRWDDPEVNMHAKAFRIDSGLQIQSANISTGGLSGNHEVAAWTMDSTALEDYSNWFEELWDTSTESPAASD